MVTNAPVHSGLEQQADVNMQRPLNVHPVGAHGCDARHVREHLPVAKVGPEAVAWLGAVVDQVLCKLRLLIMQHIVIISVGCAVCDEVLCKLSLRGVHHVVCNVSILAVRLLIKCFGSSAYEMCVMLCAMLACWLCGCLSGASQAHPEL
jgi:hypothetical protein